MILVAGGTGRLGRELIPRLTADGHQVRVLTRDPHRAAGLCGVEIVRGDIRSLADCDRAAAGADTVVAAAHGYVSKGAATPLTVDRDGNANLITAARPPGAHLVLLSVLGAAPDHPVELFRMKSAAEQMLRRSGLPWTIIRAGAFIELHTELLRRTATRAGRPLVFGRGDNPIRFSSVPDVATAVARVVRDPALRNTVVEVSGPTFTMNQLAASLEPEFGAAAERPRHIPPLALRALAAASTSLAGRRAAAALALDRHRMTPPVPTEEPS